MDALSAIPLTLVLSSAVSTGQGGTVAALRHVQQGGSRRYFAAARVDAGFLYLRPLVSLGYGRAHRSWTGFEISPLVSGQAAGGYVGLRWAHGPLSLRLGGRYTVTFQRAFLERKQAYAREDIELRDGPRSRYGSLEAEFNATPRLGPGDLLFEAGLSALDPSRSNYNVFDERLRVVIDPPWVWRTRLGYAWRFGSRDQLRVGAAAELIHNPARDAVVMRAGVLATLDVRRDLEARCMFLPTVRSRDGLGLAGSTQFILGIRYRWAKNL